MIERLILVRHGETVDNVRGVAQGWSDSELSDRGRLQVDLLARRLTQLAPTSLYSSTLDRAMTTARRIGEELQLEPHPMDDLRELNCGEWEGISFDEVRRTRSDFFARWVEDPAMRCPGGESFADVLARFHSATETIRKREDNGSGPATPVLVMHGLAIRIAATALLQLPLASARSFLQDNASLNVFDWRMGRFVLRTWNDNTHCMQAR